MSAPTRRRPGPAPPGEPDRLGANLAALATHSPEVAEKLRAVEPRAGVQFFNAASGALTARINEVTLHSTYDPVREARRVVTEQVSTETTACVILGLGLGYHAEALAGANPDLPLVVVEPDLGLLMAVLHARDLRSLLGSPGTRLLLAATPQEVATAVEDLPLGNVAVIAPTPLAALDPEYCRRVAAAVHAAADRKQINVNTLGRFGRLWVRNLLRNADALAASPGVSALVGRFRGFPALVVAAGPSLDDVEPLLPELARRMLVLAVDSSIGICLRQGVEPDIVVTVDPQYWNTRYFDRLRSPSSILVCEPSTHPSSLRRLGIPTFFTSSLFPLGRLLESVTGEKGRVGAGGSVATSAWDIARLAGCAPIYVAGLDLGFPGMRTHARGLYFEELMVSAASRTRPAQTQGYRYLVEAGVIRAASTSGGLTVTDRRMLVYKWWFERQLAQPDAPLTRTLSPQGVRIEGMAYEAPSSLLPLQERRAGIRVTFEELRSAKPHGESIARARAGVTAALATLLDDLDSLARAAEEGLRQTAALEQELGRRRGDARPRPASRARLRALEEADRRIRSCASREVTGFLMQPLIHEITGARGGDPVTASRRLYAEIRDSARLHAHLVREGLAGPNP